jgi:hypothetical protein
MFTLLKISVLSLIIIFLSSCETKDPSLVEYLFTRDNATLNAVEFEPKDVQCPKCRMPLETKENASQVVFNDGRTYIFDDPGCFILWLDKLQVDIKDVNIWIYSKDTTMWIDAKKAYYSIIDKTAMGYGFGAYEKNQTKFIDFKEMRLRMLRGETLVDPKIRKQLLSD